MRYDLPTSDDWDVRGRRVLVRVDFNTPVAAIDGRLTVTDDFRIRSALPLFTSLLDRGASVVACTHFGRPKGRVDDRFTVEPIRRRLNELCPGVELMENLRFHPGEESNDHAFGASLVEGVDFYINEAFSASHREHASIMVPPMLVPSAAGPNLRREVSFLLDVLNDPKRPFVAIVGGAKVADKLGFVRVLVDRADVVLVGGGMAYTFEASQGRTIGSSLFDATHLDECGALLGTGKVRVPVDTRGLPDGAAVGPQGGDDPVIDFGANVPDDHEGFDIGPRTVELFVDEIAAARTILWNGPMGMFEDPRFGVGTEAVARAVAASPALVVVGGGDSVAALQQFNLVSQVSFVSTGGGASLELIEYGDLPGLRALREGMVAA